jgi:hypothetical protein
MTTSAERIDGIPPPPASFNGVGYNFQGPGGENVKFSKRKQSLAGKVETRKTCFKSFCFSDVTTASLT